MASFFMGIDNGGTSTKAVLFDGRGEALGSSSRKIPMILSEPGFTERDMDTLWKANCEVIGETIASAGVDPHDIRGVACTGHGKGLYLWGRDGRPAYNGIVSTDSRAWAYPAKWKENGTAARTFGRTCQSILASQPVSILAWLKDNRPGVVEATRWVFEVKDYIRFMLTGEAFAEATDYSGSGLMNVRDARFDRELLGEFGLGEIYDLLPPLRYSTDLCGAVTPSAAAATGLAAGTPVAGGMFDIDACAVAVDVTDEDNICVIAGTWSINEYISRVPVMDGTILMNSLFCIPGFYLVEECSPTSAGNYEWFASLFLESEKARAKERSIDLYALAEEMAASVPADGQEIVFLPYIYGSNYNPRAKACFVGLEASHTRAQVIRSVLEGIALGHRVHVEKLLSARPAPRAVRLAGGAAKSALWSRIFADVLEVPVEIVQTEELGTLGCAMAAAVAAGEYGDLKAAAKAMVRIRGRIEPDPSTATIYRRKFQLHKAASAALEGIWELF
ncbi:MAG: FGGY-family carbohydrate kinase [Rectinemataceae bacterium]